MAASRISGRATALVVVGAIAIAGAFFVPLAGFRLVDNDEGFYALAAQLTWEGEVPYRDFFFLQAPGVPYVYGPWIGVFGNSLEATRALSVVLAISLAVLIGVHAHRRFGGRLWIALVAVLMFAATPLVGNWFVLTKTYALSTVLLFAAFVLVDRTSPRPSVRSFFWAGLLVALAVDTRLMFAAVLPAFAVAAAKAQPGLRTRTVYAWVSGTIVGLLPMGLLFAVAPSQFVLGNVGYHAERSEGGLIGDFGQRLDVIEELVRQPEYVVIVLLGMAGAVWGKRRGRGAGLAFWIAVTLSLVSLLPTPSYSQYFAVTTPFWIFAALELATPWSAWATDVAHAWRRRALLAGGGIVVVAFAVGGFRGVDLARRANEDSGPYASARLSSVNQVADQVDALTDPGELVVSFRPLFVFLSDTTALQGTESEYGLFTAERAGIDLADVAEYRLITNEALEEVIRDRAVRTVIAPGDTRFSFQDAGRPWDAIVAEAGYRAVAETDGVQLWTAEDAD